MGETRWEKSMGENFVKSKGEQETGEKSKGENFLKKYGWKLCKKYG